MISGILLIKNTTVSKNVRSTSIPVLVQLAQSKKTMNCVNGLSHEQLFNVLSDRIQI